jgi:hypothetical protein
MKKLRSKATRCAVLSSCALLAVPMTAWAESPPPDPSSIVTVQLENDAFSVPSTDRYYTSGERLGYVTPTGDLPGPISWLGRQMFGEGTQRLEIDVQQVIYTPVNTQLYDPNPYDRPYAGQLSLRGSLIQDTTTMRSIIGVAGGVVGPDSLAQTVQNSFHTVIGNTTNNGWHYQLNNEPTLDFFGGRIWRKNIGNIANGNINVQILPQISAQVGNTEIYAQAGGIVRFGEGLDSDFGPSLIQPQLSGTDAYTPTRPVVWYVFGGALGRIVAHDMLVQGNDFQSSRGVALTPLQGDLEIGGALIIHGVRLSVTEVFTTPEFHNAAPAFQYGSVALSTRF